MADIRKEELVAGWGYEQSKVTDIFYGRSVITIININISLSYLDFNALEKLLSVYKSFI